MLTLISLVEIIEVLSNPLFTIIITGSISILGTYLAAIQKFRKDLEAEFDKELRKERISAYMNLWKHLKILSLTHKDNKEIKPLRKVTFRGLEKLMQDMHEWYYESGIFLSTSSRSNYFNLKNAIIDVLESKGFDVVDLIEKNVTYLQDNDIISKFDTTLPPDRHNDILKKASELRKSLANDIGARRENKLLSHGERKKI